LVASVATEAPSLTAGKRASKAVHLRRGPAGYTITIGPNQAPQINTRMPQSARIWNYWLGGKDYYPVDRAAGDQY
jgi:hypothetical protein